MTISNTQILIKRSETTAAPVSLDAGELAYSYLSNTAFIGTADGTGVLKIGGQLYTNDIDTATSAATGNKLVRRDATGNASFNWVTANYFSGTFKGNADSATKLETARDIGLSGKATGNVSFDGTANVTLIVDLVNTGVVAGDYGSTTKIPTFHVDEDGRITAAANVDVATTFSFAGDTGTGSMDLLTDTLTIRGTDGVTTFANNETNTVDVFVDNTVIRTTGLLQTIEGDFQVTGNLVITGNTTTVDVLTLNVADPLIYLASNNYTTDIVDIGFVGNYFDGAVQKHAGFIRKHGGREMYAFVGYEPEPDNNIIDIEDPSFAKANIHAHFTGGRVFGLQQAIDVVDGGTGVRFFNPGTILLGNSYGGLQELQNTTFTQTGTGASNNTITSVTVDAYGRFTDATYTAISGLNVNQGGTGVSSFTTNGITYGNGTGAMQVTAAAGSADQTWSNQILTTTNAGVPVWTNTLDGGHF